MSPRASMTLDRQCKLAGLPVPETEFRFHPTRRWRFDFCWPPKSLAVEVEGGAWIGGRHTRGAGFVKDLEKYNEAALLGYTVLRVTPRMVTDGTAIRLVEQALSGVGSGLVSPPQSRKQ